jgi:hypothetical protein
MFNYFQGVVNNIAYWEDDHPMLEKSAIENFNSFEYFSPKENFSFYDIDSKKLGKLSAHVDYEEEGMLFYYEFANRLHDGNSFEDIHGKNRKDVGFDEEDATFAPVAVPISLFENKWDGVACDDD